MSSSFFIYLKSSVTQGTRWSVLGFWLIDQNIQHSPLDPSHPKTTVWMKKPTGSTSLYVAYMHTRALQFWMHPNLLEQRRHTHSHTQHIETKPKQLICNMCIIFQWILPSSCLGIGLCAKFSIKQCSLAKALFVTIGFCQPTTDIIEVHDFEYHPMKELDPPKLGKPTMF